jgi:hypothetical protein
MGVDLDRFSKIVSTSFAVDYCLVDPALGPSVSLGHMGRGETLVMAEIQIGFGAIVGDEDFSMLERRFVPGSTYRCLPLISFVVDGNNGTMS